MAKTSSDIADKPELPEKRGRGGTKGKGTRKPRPDRTEAMSLHTEPGDNRRYLEHSMQMWAWPAVDMRTPEDVNNRIIQYFQLCMDDDMKPCVEGLGLAFGVSRKTIWSWAKGIDSKYLPPESRDLIKKAYLILNTQLANYAQGGKINPVMAIFLMKNNFEYEDKAEMVVLPKAGDEDTATPEQLQEKYLQTVDADYEVVE